MVGTKWHLFGKEVPDVDVYFPAHGAALHLQPTGVAGHVTIPEHRTSPSTLSVHLRIKGQSHKIRLGRAKGYTSHPPPVLWYFGSYMFFIKPQFRKPAYQLILETFKISNNFVEILYDKILICKIF